MAVLMPSGTDVSTAAADDRAVDEVVEGVADEHERRRRAVHLAFVGMAMAEQHELFEHEEHEDAGEQRAERRPAAGALERFGQQREQRHAEQRADRVADQPRDEARPDAVGEEAAARRRRAGRRSCRARSDRGRSRAKARDILLRLRTENIEELE